MKTRFRFLIAAVIFLLIFGLVYSQSAGAVSKGSEAVQFDAVENSGDQQAAGKDPGSVKPPPPHVRINHPGNYPVGGCLVRVEELDAGFSLTVQYFSQFHRRVHLPSENDKFWAGTCLVNYFQGHKKIDELPSPENGSTFACFSVLPDVDVTIYHYDVKSKTWTPLETTRMIWDNVANDWRPANDGEKSYFACAQSNLTGYYMALGH